MISGEFGFAKVRSEDRVDRLGWEASLSFVVLVISYFCLYAALHKRTAFARYSMMVLFVASGTPLAVMLVMDQKKDYIGANIGLGMAFMLTWVITGIVLAASLTVWLMRQRKRR